MSKKEKNKRIDNIRNITIMIILTLVVGIVCLSLYYLKGTKHYMKYDERSEVDYKVLLKENDFFKEKYLDQDKEYIANLIEKISSKFKYRISFSEKANYDYSYKITSTIDINDKEKKTNLYHLSEDLITKELVKNNGDLFISENLDIDYQKYNDIVSKFIEAYELKDVESYLNIDLYINIENFDRSKTIAFIDKKVTALKIPLSNNTVSVKAEDNTINNKFNKIELTNDNNYFCCLVIGIAYLLISIGFILYLIFYLMKTRTAQMIYEKEIKSINNNYSKYIQKINNAYDIGTSQVLKVDTFTDMLEIRDTLKQPILMLENKKKDGTFFIIPATNSIIYTYALRVVDIEAKMAGREIPTYDITEISHEELMKNKKYTDKYIKEQITMTSAIPSIDTKNVIKGNKDKEKDLYDQLEMTSSFDINEIKKAQKKKKKTTTKKTTTTKKK